MKGGFDFMGRTKKQITGVSFDPDVVAYLDELRQNTDRSRSWLINAIVRDYAQQMKERREARTTELLPLSTIKL